MLNFNGSVVPDCFLNLFLHYILLIFQVVEIIGGGGERYVCPPIFSWGWRLRPLPPRIDASVARLHAVLKVEDSVFCFVHSRVLKSRLRFTGSLRGHRDVRPLRFFKYRVNRDGFGSAHTAGTKQEQCAVYPRDSRLVRGIYSLLLHRLCRR